MTYKHASKFAGVRRYANVALRPTSVCAHLTTLVHWLAGTGVTRFDELHLQVDRAAQLAWLDDLTRRQRVHELRCARRSLRSKLPSTLACVTHAVALSASRDRLEPAMLTHVLGIVGSGAQANAGAAQPAAGSHRRRRQLAASDARAHMWLASFFVKSSRRVRRIRF